MARVCIVRHNFFPEEAHICRDAEALLGHGYEVDIICLKKKGQKSRETVRGIEVHRLPVDHLRRGILRYIFEYLTFFVFAAWKLTWLHFKKRFNVVEVDTMPDFLVFITLLPKLLGARVVLYLFENMPEYYEDKFMVTDSHPVKKMLRLIEMAAAHWADHLITTQSIHQSSLQNRGIHGSKISVVMNVPDENIFKARPSSGNDNGDFRLITHGSLIEVYGIQTLIKALPLLINDIPGLKVTILGDGEYRQPLEDLARTLGVSDRLHFTGWVPFEDVSSYISRADIGLVTILAKKNPMLPNKLFEYLASGKPAVVSAIPAVKTYFDDRSVKFFEPGNERDLARCVVELFKNPEERAALAAAGLTSYRKYHWPVMKYEYIKVFDRLCSTLKPEKN